MPPGKASTSEKPVETQDTGLSDEALAKQDEENKTADPDVAQETTGGEEPRDTKPTKVRYRGIGTHRVITANEWHDAGVPGQSYVQWNRSNNYTVMVGGEAGELSEEAVARIRGDAEFSVE